MAFADTARLAVQLDLKGNFNANLRATQKALGDFDRQVGTTGSRAFKAGQQVGTGLKSGALIAAGAIGFLATQVGFGLRSLSELETVTTQTNAVLKSTKGVAGETAKSIRDLAEKYESLNATIDDKVIQSAENVLLTFTAVRKEAFEPALKAALDMSTALGTDLQGSVIQIGKALQDPIKGITALRRVGVNFSKDQITVIKRLVETGHTLEAQKLILAELQTEFGGSFLAGGNTTAGKVAKFQDAIEDLQKALASALLPTIGRVADQLSKFLADPKVVSTIEGLGRSIAGLFSDKNLAAGGRAIASVFETAKAAAPVLQQAASATLGIVKTAVSLFQSLPKEIQGLAVGAFAINKLTGGLVTNLAGGLFDVLQKARGASPANPVFVASVTGPLGGGLPGKAAGALGAVTSLATKVFIVGLAAEAASLISGPVQQLGSDIHTMIFGNRGDPLSDFGKAWDDWRKNADWPFGQKNAPEWAGGTGQPTGPAFGTSLGTALGTALAAAQSKAAITAGGFDARLANTDQAQQMAHLAESMRVGQNVWANGFRQMVAALHESKGTAAIAQAAKNAVETVVTKGRGSVESTKATLAGLREALKNTHDPKLQASIRSAIHKVEGKLPGREFAAKSLATANALLKDGKVTPTELRKLQGIEADLKNRGLPHAASVISAKVEAAKRAQVAAQDRTREAVRRKKFSATVNIPVTVSASFNVRESIRTQQTYHRAGNVILS